MRVATSKGKKMFYNSKKQDQQKLQEQHLERVKTSPWGARLFSGNQVIQSLRNVGYQHEGNAIADIMDNSIEAGATEIDVLFNEEKARAGSFNAIAIVDNGHGMQSDYLPLAIGIGSTSRAKNDQGLGRFGMGLTSAGTAFSNLLEVYSRADNGKWYKTFIDLRPESKDYFSDEYIHGKLEGSAPKAEPAELPKWIVKSCENLSGPGTVVVLSDFPTRMRKWSRQHFKTSLMTHLGITYFKMAGQFDIRIDSKLTEFIDPLFLTPGLRGYDLDGITATPINDGFNVERFDKQTLQKTGKIDTYNFEEVCEVKDPETGETLCNASIRLAVMSPQFALKKEYHEVKGTSATTHLDPSKGTGNFRASIIKDYTGVILIRNNRVIGVDRFKPTRFGNNDQNIGVEFCFTGEADELFGVTYQKNKISLSQDVWNSLSKLGLVNGIIAARAHRDLLFAEWRKDVNTVKDPEGNVKRPFELAASVATKKARKQISGNTEAKIIDIGKRNLDEAVKDLSQLTGETKESIHKNLPKVLTDEWKVTEEHLMGADFVSFRPIGAFSTRIVVNKDHPFYTNVYGSPDCDPYIREVIGSMFTSLFRALAITEHGPANNREALYPSVLGEHFLKNWSELLADHIRELSAIYMKPAENDEDNSPVSETQPA